MAEPEVMKRAKAAINAVFGDTSVAPGKTADRLAELREEIEGLMDLLPEPDDG